MKVWMKDDAFIMDEMEERREIWRPRLLQIHPCFNGYTMFYWNQVCVSKENKS